MVELTEPLEDYHIVCYCVDVPSLAVWEYLVTASTVSAVFRR